jgi:hypothetical protein
VWIGGEHLLNEGEFTRARAADVTERARGWQRRLEAHT